MTITLGAMDIDTVKGKPFDITIAFPLTRRPHNFPLSRLTSHPAISTLDWPGAQWNLQYRFLASETSRVIGQATVAISGNGGTHHYGPCVRRNRPVGVEDGPRGSDRRIGDSRPITGGEAASLRLPSYRGHAVETIRRE
jgi:hypothetical protein